MNAGFATLVRGLNVIAMAALLVMMGVTVVDVTMRVALSELVLGSVEVVQLMLVVVVFLALPEATLSKAHVTVDVVDPYVAPRSLRRLRRGAAFATGALLTLMAVRTVPPALDVIELGDLTTDLQISLAWYWLPIIAGTLVAAAAAWIAWRDELRAGRDELRPGRDELRPGRDELRPGRDALRPGRDELRAGRDELRADRNGS